MREIYTDYLGAMGTSAAQMARAEKMPALREQCSAHEGYLFTVDAYVDDAAAGKMKAVVDKVRTTFDEKYTPLFKQNIATKRSIHMEGNAIKKFISGKNAEIRNLNTVCKAEIDALYDTCLKKIIRFIVRLFGGTFYGEAVNKIEAGIRPLTAVLTREIGQARKASDARIARFRLASHSTLMTMRKLSLSYDEKRVLALATPTVFRRTAEQLAFVANPIDEHKESEAGGNTKAARERFLRSVETSCRKKMHVLHRYPEVAYRLAFEDQEKFSDIQLVYRRMTTDELGGRVGAAKVLGAIAPPPPPPVQERHVRSTEEQARWDSECAASHGCWKSVTH